MLRKFWGLWILLPLLLGGFSIPTENASARSALSGVTEGERGKAHPRTVVEGGYPRPLKRVAAQTGAVTAFDLILAMNTLRVSRGLPALIEDPIVNAVAQATAQTMAANNMSWHIGDVRGRIQAAGYGGGATVWATENFAVGTSMGIDQIMLVWADPDHMRPATTPAYCHIGAGVAKAADGRVYYVLQAAYTSTSSCGEYTYPEETGSEGGSNSGGGNPVPQIIFPVKIATPDEQGQIYHTVRFGQSFWSIAVAYQVTIAEIEFWNNLSRDRALLVGKKLFIPSESTEGYATPTPVGMVVPSPPGADGKIVHQVEPYQTLSTIARAYTVNVNTILALNGIQIDWPLQIGQKLLIYPGNVTPTPTPRPLTPIEKLTPASDGRYYHTVRSGESLSWIAGLYEIAVADLMAWNGLSASTIIQPDQVLLLQVTPPATATANPEPPSATAANSPSPTPFSLSPSPPTQTAADLVIPTATATRGTPVEGTTGAWLLGVMVAAVGVVLLLVIFFTRRFQ